jgi:Trm5-related predicted tRNA methylase
MDQIMFSIKKVALYFWDKAINTTVVRDHNDAWLNLLKNMCECASTRGLLLGRKWF